MYNRLGAVKILNSQSFYQNSTLFGNKLLAFNHSINLCNNLFFMQYNLLTIYVWHAVFWYITSVYPSLSPISIRQPCVSPFVLLWFSYFKTLFLIILTPSLSLLVRKYLYLVLGFRRAYLGLLSRPGAVKVDFLFFEISYS